MSESVSGFTVFLKKDVSEEHAERIREAIEMLGGVLRVKSHVADYDLDLAEERARYDLGERIRLAVCKEIASRGGE